MTPLQADGAAVEDALLVVLQQKEAVTQQRDALLAALRALREETMLAGNWYASDFGWRDVSAQCDAAIAQCEAAQ